jgi:hypothetical protein
MDAFLLAPSLKQDGTPCWVTLRNKDAPGVACQRLNKNQLIKSAIVNQSQAMPNQVERRTAILDSSEAQQLLRPNESWKQHERERQIEKLVSQNDCLREPYADRITLAERLIFWTLNDPCKRPFSI